MARLLHLGLDLLILAYAKAESMETDPEEKYGDLRSHWGMFLYNMIQKMLAANDGNSEYATARKAIEPCKIHIRCGHPIRTPVALSRKKGPKKGGPLRKPTR